MRKTKQKSRIKIHCSYDSLVKIEDLVAHPKNPNRHSRAQIERLSQILLYQGIRRPVRQSKLSNYVTAGHGLIDALKNLSEKEVPVNFQDYESEEQEYADIIADNAIASWAELDLSQINIEIPDMGPDFDIDLLGIKDFVIEPADKYGDQDADEIPNIKKTSIILGDMFALGNHRLFCGDSTCKDSVEKLMNGEKADLMVTDPPYGIELDQSWRDEALGDKALGKGNKLKISGDNRADWTDVWRLAPTEIAYVWHASSFTDVVMQSLRNADFEVRQQIIWNKSVMVMGRSAYHFKHEPCWYAVKSGATAKWVGDRKQTTVWDAASPNHIMSGSLEEKTEHPTQKPSVLYEIPIHNHTKINGLLYEPFSG